MAHIRITAALGFRGKIKVRLTRRGRPVVRLVRAGDVPRAAARAAAVKRIRSLRKRLNLSISRAEVMRAIAKGRD